MFGKVVGAVIGVIVGLLIGSVELGGGLTVVGLVLGHFFFDHDWSAGKRPKAVPNGKEVSAKALERAEKAAAQVEKLARTLAPIFIEVARSDGEVSRDEIRVVREFFQNDLHYDEAALGAVSIALKEAMAKPSRDLVKLVVKARKEVKPQDRLRVVDALYGMALSDGPLRKAEADSLKQIVANFNLSEEQIVQITRRYLGSGEKHYQALGLTEAASDDEIRGAFRKLAAENHPDKAAHLGKEEAAQAAERFRLVKDAYEELKKLRGL